MKNHVRYLLSLMLANYINPSNLLLISVWNFPPWIKCSPHWPDWLTKGNQCFVTRGLSSAPDLALKVWREEEERKEGINPLFSLKKNKISPFSPKTKRNAVAMMWSRIVVRWKILMITIPPNLCKSQLYFHKMHWENIWTQSYFSLTPLRLNHL